MAQKTCCNRYQPRLKKESTPTTEGASWDFTIMVDGTEFKSHREILCSTSTYFDALFRSNMREAIDGRVVLQGMRSETFAVVLNFIHQRVHGLTADNIDDIWEAANRLDVRIYLKEIEQFVIDNLSIDNLWHFHLKAVDFNSNNVKDVSLRFMRRNFEQVFRMNEFLNLSFELVLSCLESEELNVETEDSVLESIVTWVSHGRYRPGGSVSHDRSSTRKVGDERECQSRVGRYRDDTTTCEWGNVITVGQKCDSRTVVEAGDATKGKPGYVTKDGQPGDVKNEDHTGDVTTSSRTGDRATYLAKLMSTAKLILATESYLQSLLRNPYVTQSPDAHHLVQEALKYKCGVYPFESAFLEPLRMCSVKRNALAFLGKSGLHLYDLESRTFSRVNVENVNGHFKYWKSLISLGSRLAFMCVKRRRCCPFATHRCQHTTVLLLDENKIVSPLYELCGEQKMPVTLVRVNNKILCVKTSDLYATTRRRMLEPDLLKTVTLNTGIQFNFACEFDNDILFFKNEYYPMACNRGFEINSYNMETNSLTTHHLPNVSGSNKVLVIHKDKDMYLLLSCGVLLSVHRGSDNAMEFTPVVDLWRNFHWMFTGAVCYKNELLLFTVVRHVSHGRMRTSVPRLFEKISVVELGVPFKFGNVVPIVAPVSWVG